MPGKFESQDRTPRGLRIRGVSSRVLGVFSRLKAVKRQVRSLVALNLELAKLEEKQKATALGIAGGLGAGAAVLPSTESASHSRPARRDWRRPCHFGLRCSSSQASSFSSLRSLGFLAVRSAQKVSPPQPAQAIQEAELTLKTLRGNG